jgi:hypothetical protein
MTTRQHTAIREHGHVGTPQFGLSIPTYIDAHVMGRLNGPMPQEPKCAIF